MYEPRIKTADAFFLQSEKAESSGRIKLKIVLAWAIAWGWKESRTYTVGFDLTVWGNEDWSSLWILSGGMFDE
jgi:hypothetical protein